MAGSARFRRDGLDRADYESTISDLISEQHFDTLGVVMFNFETDRAEDVSDANAQEIRRRLGLEVRSVFIDPRRQGSPAGALPVLWRPAESHLMSGESVSQVSFTT